MRRRLPRRAWWVLGLATLAASAWALNGEVALRRGPHGVEAVRFFDDEYTVTDVVDDGPYVRYVDGGLEARWVCAGEPVTLAIPVPRWPATVPVRCGWPRPLLIDPPAAVEDAPRVGTGGRRLVALSDVHGQFPTMLRLLQAHGVVDANGDWAFDDGTLVMPGDVFDRGSTVTEAFWQVYTLERQARAAGGAVHFLLGNHEALVLREDLRYVNGKYARTAELLGRRYPELYAADTVLGAWLRGKRTLLQVDDLLFLHAGIDASYLALGLDIARTNELFRGSLGLDKAALAADPVLQALHGESGPIWYRGYFHDEALTADDVDAQLRALGVRRIVVGHTSMPEVLSLFDGRVIAIDSSIKKGVGGELLIVEDGVPWRGLIDGRRLPL